MLKKVGLWRGLAFVFVILLSFAIAAAIALESFRSQIDPFLGTRSEEIVTTDDGTLYGTFTPPEDVLNSDGTGNSDKLIEKFIDFGRRQAAGGTALLKNENNALPLASGSKVTLLGIRSHVMLQGASFGMPISGPIIPFEQALSANKTDFRNPDCQAPAGRTPVDVSNLTDHTFDGAGYTLNPDMIADYKALNDAKPSASKLTATGPRQNKTFDPGEPSLAEIAAIDADYQNSFANYHDAAIVVVGRPSGESNDYLPGGVVEGLGVEEPLQLTTNEKDMIALATEKFDRVIVLINTTSAMEIDDLKHNDKIDSILWIGHPGNYGTLGVADILCGKVSPSGGMSDIYAASNMSHPAMQNMGDYTFANADTFTRTKSKKYVMEPESIYVGYRYYETRYNDIIEARGNADSKAGAVASSGNWNYSEEVTYGFGYGLTYSDVTQEIVGSPTITQTAHSFTMDFNVKVTNSATGKKTRSNIQLYGQAPYKSGGVEKSAIQLLAYEKTEELAPGASVTVPLHVDLQNIASYDSTHKNADGTYGTYILDEGDYYFAVGNGAHDALNNILAKQGKTKANTSNKMDYDGKANMAYKYTYSFAGGDVDDVTFSLSKTNTKVSNHLEYADWNSFKGASGVTYLSRNKWDTTFPKEYKDLTAPESMIPMLNGQYYKIKTTDDTSDIKFGVTPDGGAMSYTEMKLSTFDDPRWDTLMNQISLEDAMSIVACGGNKFRSLDSVGFVGGSFTENSGNGVALTLKNTITPAAPWTIPETDSNINYPLEVFGCGPLVASSFDPALQYELGEIVGLQALFVGLPILWGPGLNTHRHPYNGRNGDYYSEDPVLCGNIAMEFAIGALEYGLIAAPKHFAFNDQETNRNGIAPFMTEQRAREVELRAFQIAVEATKYDTAEKDAGMIGLMDSFSKIGPVECTCSRGLMTDILQSEWGFHGYAVTDISDDFDLYTAVAYSGTTGYDVRAGYTESGFAKYQSMADGVVPSPDLYANDAAMLTAFKRASKNVLWAFCQSNLMNSVNSTSHVEWRMTWWRGAYIAMLIVFGVLLIAAAALYVLSVLKTRKEAV